MKIQEEVSIHIYYSMDIYNNPDSINPNLEYDQSISITEIAVKKYLTYHRGDRLESFSISTTSACTAI